MFDTRKGNILEAAVREFIRIGEPVSSQHLYDVYGFGVKPAMIRLELSNLTDEGYLEQPHHSAGRVPTNRGYEFFAERAIEGSEIRPHGGGRLFPLVQRMELKELLDELSNELGLLAAAITSDEDMLYKDGLDGLIDHLEWHSRSELSSVIRDFEELDEHVSDATEALNHEDAIRVFIGKKSPITKSKCLSVMVGRYEVDGDKLLLFVIGPNRMDYEKTAKIMRGLRKENNQKHE